MFFLGQQMRNGHGDLRPLQLGVPQINDFLLQKRSQIHLFILRIYIAPPQETNSEALSAQPRRHKTDLSSL